VLAARACPARARALRARAPRTAGLAFRADLPAATKPPDATHVRLLFAGKFLEDDKVLQDVQHVSVSDTTTFHVIVMAPPAEVKPTGAALPNEKVVAVSGTGTDASGRQSASGRCQCVVS